MSAARWASLAIVAAGAIAGSMLDAPRAADPPRVGPFYVLAADFHVHAFPGDGALPSWELAREASRRGLHVIVISNHNQTLAARLGRTGTFEPGSNVPVQLPLVIPAQEVTTPGFHLVAVGITRTIDWRLSGIDIVDDVHAQGGVVIAAHPVGRYWRGSDAMLAAMDGAEVAHPVTNDFDTARGELTAFFTGARTFNPNLAPIGSSDFHMVGPLGLCRTHVFAEAVTTDGVLAAIRAGRTVAEDQDGVLYGDPELTRIVEQSRAVNDPSASRGLVLLSAAMVLLGLLALVVLR